jgi:NAD(P)-dependent dehydrogenase (short-subunit alcohol dehydrogenase family)
VDLPRTPSLRLDGKRALITGAGRGIGLGLAAALASAGASVTLLARGKSEIEAAAAAIGATGARANAASLDVADTEALRHFFEGAPPFDILVNNAGMNRPKNFSEVTEDDFDVVLGLNLRAAFFVAQLCAKRMISEAIEGSLIHIGSQMGHVGGRNRSLYCASKWGLEGMSKALALDLAPHRIRSNTIAPTFVETELTKPFFEDGAFKREVLRKIQLGRLGRVEDLMGAAVFLASQASALVTGTSILVDGGWTAE